ncbi:hypothetical protein FPOAC2_12994 [Fusarium poae]|uniref:hypothetical protein n=1 Tax=Fusarium poae TaxID=36050 RepID=UPI001CE9FF7E|nr:hypothetical protein FPOAC1_012634 [Fusarium poae]KAG8667795.1 hypothetical protein FPOAC1_012634 [Fusarium poae]
MKLSLFLSAIGASGALADFTVFMTHHTSPASDFKNYQVHDGTPRTWAEMKKSMRWAEKSDVSGRKVGVRCKGSGCGYMGPVSNIEQLEMHFTNNPLYHWTIYKDRNWGMYGRDGVKYGDCQITTGNDFTVINENDKVVGHRKFRCRSRFTAHQINQGSRS